VILARLPAGGFLWDRHHSGLDKLRTRFLTAMDLIANWSKAMNEEMKVDQRVLRDDELEAVNGGAVSTTAHMVTFTQSISFSAPLHFGPILSTQSLLSSDTGRLACGWGLILSFFKG
jgi:hypothetical protein